MYDACSTLYLWQGWCPPDIESTECGSPSGPGGGGSGSDSEGCAGSTGSGLVRWHAERRAAMSTLLEYREAKGGKSRTRVQLVWAGHEPQQFINLFPEWKLDKEAKTINKEVLSLLLANQTL